MLRRAGDATAGGDGAGVLVLPSSCCADCECCDVLAMLLLVTMVLVCWGGPRHANRECCAVLAILLLVGMVLECGCRVPPSSC
jgi:hypothetical protein